MPDHAHILQRSAGQAYVHYVGTDKRLDEWIPDSALSVAANQGTSDTQADDSDSDSDASMALGADVNESGSKRRKRGRPTRQGSISEEQEQHAGPSQPTPASTQQDTQREVIMTEEDFDIEAHKKITAQRNFDKVFFGEWQVKTWYFSPYPLTETELDEPPPAPSALAGSKIPGVSKATPRSHGRTSDLLAGGLGRNYAGGEKASLWVCQQCFKYMADGNSYDLHLRYCNVDYPPGKNVYQRGAHTIWEVDGAKEKLYCQNLSLFGKLFIDVKTLFFDCEGCALAPLPSLYTKI
ncbi:hypothetical protein H0H81_001670 [Sphagnurus paluster]|uniref:MYST-type HAT domain-containing protein n=1 Tax=Sphagnurus paluster TaxID=117069 RepID=A0A9P7GJW8_9AGAR|nr:hypothetical protein H0H81_001670 [Sphagnurus paluster]